MMRLALDGALGEKGEGGEDEPPEFTQLRGAFCLRNVSTGLYAFLGGNGGLKNEREYYEATDAGDGWATLKPRDSSGFMTLNHEGKPWWEDGVAPRDAAWRLNKGRLQFRRNAKIFQPQGRAARMVDAGQTPEPSQLFEVVTAVAGGQDVELGLPAHLAKVVETCVRAHNSTGACWLLEQQIDLLSATDLQRLFTLSCQEGIFSVAVALLRFAPGTADFLRASGVTGRVAGLLLRGVEEEDTKFDLPRETHAQGPGTVARILAGERLWEPIVIFDESGGRPCVRIRDEGMHPGHEPYNATAQDIQVPRGAQVRKVILEDWEIRPGGGAQ
jgi:hypothetical protein